MSLISLSTDRAPGAVGPYSQGIKAGNIVFTSGQLPMAPGSTEIMNGDIKKETKQCIENVLAVLEAGDAKLEDIAKVNIFITDMDDFPAVNEVYGEYFNEHKPARACVQVSRLPGGADVEIEAIAVL
ncbi:MAG: RidA family protein [Tissierellia bacterium]|nr:RidA family protein [Tissierellia bacterium]